MERLSRAHEMHRERGARFLATNPDNWCPVSSEQTRPGAGATSAFLEASTGRRAYYLGKPNGYMFHRARRKLSEVSLTQPDQVVMIGDTMETDIRGAVETGLLSYLVLSGSTPNWKTCATMFTSPREFCTALRTWLRRLKPALIRIVSTARRSTKKDFIRPKTDTNIKRTSLPFHLPRPRPAMTK